MPERMYGSFFPSPEAWKPVQVPERQPATWSCGGTAHILPKERVGASFSVKEMTSVIDGGAKATAKKWFLWRPTEDHDNSMNYFLERKDLVPQHLERFIQVHRAHAEKGYQPTPHDITLMGAIARNSGALTLHYGAFAPTLLRQMTAKQMMEWLRPTYTLRIIGCLAQTELAHGSNVRGLQTTAHYDAAAEEFVLNTPTLGSMKWWPGGLGKSATHAALYAQLHVGGKCYGVHTFLLQLRDENHRPLPGITLGEVGPKIGDNFTETGFLRLQNVRIPRTWLMMKNQEVTKDGRYVPAQKKGAGGGKAQYLTMLSIRAGLVMMAGFRLAQGVTIAVRYSCVRHQGFVDTSQSAAYTSEERPIIDYQNQQLRVFRQLAFAYAMVFTGKGMSDMMGSAAGAGATGMSSEDISEMVGVSAGLKAVCTMATADGLEDCRKCCGGHGVLLSSGIAAMARDYLPTVTAEGDRVVLELTSAKYLIRALDDARSGRPLASSTRYLREQSAAPAGGLRDRAVLLHLFEQRSRASIAEADRRLREERESGTPDNAWNSCSVDLVSASRAHCAVMILRHFATEVDKVKDAACRAALGRLCSLHALLQMQEAAADWVGMLTATRMAEVRMHIRNLLAEIRPDAVTLVDAFEFPDNVLCSALGRYDGNVYETLFAAAQASPLNSEDPFPGYENALRPFLDVKFLEKNKKKVRSAKL
eukprot:TRINITY_DN2433_c7_g1_i1.p1 TRINITY_DN2433_c7_g1~~TRINITY_DN2433_c7_g1_i1.p1  ORF type:complete len:702 (+),score=237.82 TRINITY_DN2433_c7_g1_i1:62-2167(+)